MKLTKITAASFVALALATSAQAAMITGSIDIGANSTVSINFVANSVAFNPNTNNAEVTYSDGVLGTLLPANTTLTYANFTYDPLGLTNPIWTDGVTSFNLLSIFEIEEDSTGSTQALKLFGTGILTTTVAGYQDTPGLWSFTADSTTGGTRFSWSSTTSQRVPDGGATFALLGASLVGLGGIRRLLSAVRK